MSIIDELLEAKPKKARCSACGFESSGEPSSCPACGHRLREPSAAAKREAVLGESDVLDDLELSEADLAESVDRPSGGGGSVKLDRQLAGWVRSLRDPSRRGGALPAERVVEIVGGSFEKADVDRALRLVEARAAATDDEAERDELSEGLDGWLDDRIEG